MSPRDPASTARFGSCAEAYASGRPGYPAALGALVRELLDGAPQPPGDVVDLGAGTGLFTTLLADSGARVIAIEPNEPMRAQLTSALAGRSNVSIRAGTAEATGLPDESVDLVTAAQAFHWFDPRAARAEADRILRPSGRSLFVWNTRRTDVPHMRELNDIVRRFARDYDAVGHLGPKRADALAAYAGARAITKRELSHAHRMTREAFDAWLASISYLPRAPDPALEPLQAAMADFFERHAAAGTITLLYTAEAYVIEAAPAP